MDSTTEAIAQFAHTTTYDDIPAEVRRHAARNMIDTLACAIGAVDSKVNRIARELAPRLAEGSEFGRVIGSADRTTPEMAAFQNTAMIRNLDYNDVYPGGHPSEALGPLLAVAGARDLSGRELMRAMVVAYETHNRIGEAAKLRTKGWDHSTQISISASAGLSNLLSLPYDAICNAVALNTAAGVSLGVTRSGELSDWTASATGQAGRDAIFLTSLAERGVTGPPSAFEGRHGVWDNMSGQFTMRPFPTASGGEWLSTRMRHKFWPVEFHTQISIAAAEQLRERVKLEDIESITIWTYEWAYFETASEKEKWHPRTPDTANHSLPYLFARMFLVGEIDLGAFEEQAYMDPVARALMQRIGIDHDPKMDEIYPETIPVRVECELTSGDTVELSLENPRGHPKNPMTDEEISEKFTKMAARRFDSAMIEKALSFWWSFHDQPGIAKGMDILAAED